MCDAVLLSSSLLLLSIAKPFYASALECNKNFFDGKRKLRDGCCGLVHNATKKDVSYLYPDLAAPHHPYGVHKKLFSFTT